MPSGSHTKGPHAKAISGGSTEPPTFRCLVRGRVQKRYVDLDIQIQRAAETLNEGGRAGLGGGANAVRLPDEM